METFHISVFKVTFASIATPAVGLGVYDSAGRQVDLVRIITDTFVIGSVCGVFHLGEHRGRGLGRSIMELTVNHPLVRDVKRLALRTEDAHELYEQFGFVGVDAPGRRTMGRVRRRKPVHERRA